MENRSQIRNVKLICAIEQNLADLAWRACRLDNIRMSRYLRKLIIEDLKLRGLIQEENNG